jgi:hypothetical protein
MRNRAEGVHANLVRERPTSPGRPRAAGFFLCGSQIFQGNAPAAVRQVREGTIEMLVADTSAGPAESQPAGHV